MELGEEAVGGEQATSPELVNAIVGSGRLHAYTQPPALPLGLSGWLALEHTGVASLPLTGDWLQ